jgi:hypothetical protein
MYTRGFYVEGIKDEVRISLAWSHVMVRREEYAGTEVMMH